MPPLFPTDLLGQRRGFSNVDLQQLHKLYDCDPAQPTKATKLQHPPIAEGRSFESSGAPDEEDERQLPRVPPTPALKVFDSGSDDICHEQFRVRAAMDFFGSLFFLSGDRYWKINYDDIHRSFSLEEGYPRLVETGWVGVTAQLKRLMQPIQTLGPRRTV